jgi:hypothetical protein
MRKLGSMKPMEVFGGLLALKGAGIAAGAATLCGFRFFDGWPKAWVLMPLMFLGVLAMLAGLGLMAAAEDEEHHG